MKRILYVLVALFAMTFHVKASASDVAHSNMSSSCDPSWLFLGPVAVIQGTPPNCADYTIAVPSIVGCSWVNLNGFYSFVVTDAAGTTIAFVPNTPDTSVFVTLPSYGQYFVHVQYSYIDENGVGQSVTADTDFYFNGCQTPCPPSSLSLGPISVVQGPTMHCSDFIISVPPITGCPWSPVNGYYQFLVYEGTNTSIPVAGRLYTESNSIDVQLGYEGIYIIEVEFHYTDINGVAHVLTETLSFVFDNCDCDYIEAPSTFDCEVGPSGVIIGNTEILGITITWNEPNNAVGYEYEGIGNDPDCCPDGGSLFNLSGSTSRFSKLNFLGAPCFSFRVRAICADGTAASEWSDWICSCTLDDEMREEFGEKSLIQAAHGELDLSAAPNPAKNHVDITFSGGTLEKYLKESEVIINDTAGKEMYRSTLIPSETKRVDVSGFKTGLYFIAVVHKGTVLTSKKLLVE